MSPDELFTRDEVLGGLPARRAATLLFLIESRSAQLEARSRLAAEEFPTEKAAEELDLAFLEAFASKPRATIAADHSRSGASRPKMGASNSGECASEGGNSPPAERKIFL